MLLCGIQDVRAGAVLGAIVADPRVPGHDLLRPGVTLEAAMLASLKQRGVTELWIEDDLSSDLDAAVAPQLIAARREVYGKLREGLAACARGTLTVATAQSYRQSVLGLVTEAISSAQYASMTDALFGCPGQDAHGANVAYLSLLIGLHIESYVISEQPRLSRDDAREMSVLGLCGLLHDLGKVRLPPRVAAFHDIDAPESGGSRARPDRYLEHTALGHKLLEESRVPARVAHAVLNHHQRFDGKGWPDLAPYTAGRILGPLAGRKIHVFARIVAAANVLDNLMRDASGGKRPPVAALWAFASSKYDGWFDPVVRRAALLRIPPFAIGTSVKLSDGRRGVVVAPTPDDPCRPLVRVAPVRDEQPQTVDLHATPGLQITHALGEDVARYHYEAPPIPLTEPEEFSGAAAAVVGQAA